MFFFAIVFIFLFYLFGFSVRCMKAKHTTGKMDAMYKLWITCGCVMMVLSLYMGIRTKNFINNAKRIPAEVIQLVENNTNELCFIPVFSYRNSENIEMQMKSKTCAYPPVFSVGDKIDLLFNPNNPNDDPIENERFALWGGKLNSRFHRSFILFSMFFRNIC